MLANNATGNGESSGRSTGAEPMTSPEQFEKWLDSKENEIIHVVAARMVLRLVPTVFRLLENAKPDSLKPLFLFILRGGFLYFAYAQYPTIRVQLREIASSLRAPDYSILSGRDQLLEDVLPAIVHALSELLSTEKPERLLLEIIESAGLSSLMEASYADAEWVDLNGEANLSHQPLWLIDVRGRTEYLANFPDWAREPFDLFDQSELVQKGTWGIWTRWYRALLPNSMNLNVKSAFGEKVDIALATQPASFWDHGDADEVTLKIAKKQFVKNVDTTDFVTVVPNHSDEPTENDQLGRRPFSQALADRIIGLREEGGADGFAIHLHAPWGAGKTSILRMLRGIMSAHSVDRRVELQDNKNSSGVLSRENFIALAKASRDVFREKMGYIDRLNSSPKHDPKEEEYDWIVVEFNAWHHERRRPPWWPLIEAVKEACVRESELSHDLYGLWRLKLEWWIWKLTADWFPSIVAMGALGLFSAILWEGSGTAATTIKTVGALVAVIATFVSVGRVMVFGSTKSAAFYLDISSDPMRRIKRLFEKIVVRAGKPICILIDDLDRCNDTFVVELLEGIQTSFRHRDVAYVVAADRAWLKASFRNQYEEFSDHVGSDGLPIGYLFLEKIFQVSTPIPGMGRDRRDKYWKALIGGTFSDEPTEVPSEEEITTRLAKIGQRGVSLSAAQARKLSQEDPDPAMVAALVKASNKMPEAETEREHLLACFSEILPDNPRVMKRMVNAFAFRQSISILEGKFIDAGVLARWTILEQCYPAVADILIEEPTWTSLIARNVSPGELELLPEPLRRFNHVKKIRKIIEMELEGEDLRPLTNEEVAALSGGGK